MPQFKSERRLRDVERVTEVPLLVLAVALIPLLLLPAFYDLPDAAKRSFAVGDWLIWGVFAAVFAIKLAVAPRRLEFLRNNWLEVLMVVLPMLRPLRFARFLRFARLITVVGFNIRVIERILSSQGTRFIATATLGVLVIGATAVLIAERNAEGTKIDSFGDAVWWATVTMATVGYGDEFPVTPAGRGIAVAVMIVGVAALSALTAGIAAFMVRESEEVELRDIMHEIKKLREEIAALQSETADSGNPDTAE